jgi:hypothetical protein
VERVLLDRDGASHGLFRATTVRRLLDETRRGQADHGYPLQILLNLELWQRGRL